MTLPDKLRPVLKEDRRLWKVVMDSAIKACFFIVKLWIFAVHPFLCFLQSNFSFFQTPMYCPIAYRNPCSPIYSLNFLTDQVLRCKHRSSGRSWIRALIFSSYSRVYSLGRPDFGLGFNPSSPSLLNRSIHLST